MKKIKTITSLVDTFKNLIEDNDVLIMQDDYDDILESIEKQSPLSVVKGSYCEELDHFELNCPKCNSCCGALENEDGDGVYKHNLAYEWCPDCGQRIKY